jgi:GT2 family glycosyltransferase
LTPRPQVSVVVPAYNAGGYLHACLDAILASPVDRLELIVVDDCSTDDTVEVARGRGAKVLRMARNGGPGAARNRGVDEARGEIVVFVDADVVVGPRALPGILRVLEEEPDVTAVFGSYDDEPAAKSPLSQYKNLYHHFVHQRGNPEAETFWAGFGAVRRGAFLAVGGFDAERYPEPSIEDIELGYRLRRAGHRIRLDRTLLVKHLKRWTLRSWLRADIRCRAIPWTFLILERGQLINDLNVRWSERLRTALVFLLCAAVVLGLVFHVAFLAVAGGLLGAAVGSLWQLVTFFAMRRGPLFAAFVVPLHLFYYLYCGATFVLCWLVASVFRRRPVLDPTGRLSGSAPGD